MPTVTETLDELFGADRTAVTTATNPATRGILDELYTEPVAGRTTPTAVPAPVGDPTPPPITGEIDLNQLTGADIDRAAQFAGGRLEERLGTKARLFEPQDIPEELRVPSGKFQVLGSETLGSVTKFLGEVASLAVPGAQVPGDIAEKLQETFAPIEGATKEESEIRRLTIKSIQQAVVDKKAIEPREVQFASFIAKAPFMSSWHQNDLDKASLLAVVEGVLPKEFHEAVAREQDIRRLVAGMKKDPNWVDRAISFLRPFVDLKEKVFGRANNIGEANRRLIAEANEISVLNLNNILNIGGGTTKFVLEMVLVAAVSPTSAAGMFAKASPKVRAILKPALESAGLFGKSEAARQLFEDTSVTEKAKAIVTQTALGALLGPTGNIPLKFKPLSALGLTLAFRESVRLQGGSEQDVNNVTIAVLGFQLFSVGKQFAFSRTAKGKFRAKFLKQAKEVLRTKPAGMSQEKWEFIRKTYTASELADAGFAAREAIAKQVKAQEVARARASTPVGGVKAPETPTPTDLAVPETRGVIIPAATTVQPGAVAVPRPDIALVAPEIQQPLEAPVSPEVKEPTVTPSGAIEAEPAPVIRGEAVSPEVTEAVVEPKAVAPVEEVEKPTPKAVVEPEAVEATPEEIEAAKKRRSKFLAEVKKGRDKRFRLVVSTRESPDTVSLDEIAISEERRGKGLGSAEITRITKLADKHGITIALRALEGREAFFARAGFELINEEFSIMARKPQTGIERAGAVPAAAEAVSAAPVAPAKPTVSKKEVAGPPARNQLAQGHILAKEVGLTENNKPNAEYRALAFETTGKESMSDMTQDEAKQFIAALQEMVVQKKAPKKPLPRPFDSLTTIERSRIRKPMGPKGEAGDVLFKKLEDYAGEMDLEPPEDPQLRKGVIDTLSLIGRQMKKADAKAKKWYEKHARGRFSILNPWSSATKAFSGAEIRSGIPLQRDFTALAHTGAASSMEARELFEGKLKAIGEGMRTGFSKEQNGLIADWLRAENKKQQDAIWENLDERARKMATVLHNFLQDESAKAIREARWRIWDRVDRRLGSRITDLKIQRKAERSDAAEAERLDIQIKALEAQVQQTIPPNIRAKDYDKILTAGRNAKAEGKLAEWIATQAWGTRAHYFMTEQAPVDIIDAMMPTHIAEQFITAEKEGAGPTPLIRPGGVDTRFGDPSRAQVENVIGAVLHHYERAAMANATADQLEAFWESVDRAGMSKADIKYVRDFTSSLLGRSTDAGLVTRIVRTANRIFWRTHFLSAVKSAWFFTRNLFQNIAFAGSQLSIGRTMRSMVRITNPKTRAGGFKEWFSERWQIDVSQKRRIYHQFLLQEEGNMPSDVRSRLIILADMIGQLAPYSDEINRLGVGLPTYQSGWDAASDYASGKMSYNKLTAALKLDALLLPEQAELQSYLSRGMTKEFSSRYAEMKVANIHFKYETAFRSALEQTPGNRAFLGLLTFPRGTWELFYNGGAVPLVTGIKTGNFRQAYRGLQSLIMLWLGAKGANYLLKIMTGKDAYDLWDTITAYSPLGPGAAKINDLFDGISTIRFRAQKGDWTTAKRADAYIGLLANNLEMMLPVTDTMVNIYEAANDKKGVRIWKAVRKEARKRWLKEHGKPWSKTDRTWWQGVSHVIWGGFEDPPKKGKSGKITKVKIKSPKK